MEHEISQTNPQIVVVLFFYAIKRKSYYTSQTERKNHLQVAAETEHRWTSTGTAPASSSARRPSGGWVTGEGEEREREEEEEGRHLDLGERGMIRHTIFEPMGELHFDALD